MITDWDSLRRHEATKQYWADLQRFLEEERSDRKVYPPVDEVFAALELTPLAKVKVVILGQDPYPGEGQAHGLAFSVRPAVRPPPSLQNIYQELESDLGIRPPNHGCLEHWARQGVLLLNTALTVRAGEAESHVGKGWETFTDEVLRVVSSKEEPTVFMLWGRQAQRKKRLISEHHLGIESSHPSPLGVYRGFRGSRPFSRANEFLLQNGREPVDWQIPDL